MPNDVTCLEEGAGDSESLPSDVEGLNNRPEAKNLVNIYSGLSGLSPQVILSENGGRDFSKFKPDLAELAVSVLTPISNEMTHLMKEPDQIDKILGNGAAKAAKIANPILEQTYDIVGLIRRK